MKYLLRVIGVVCLVFLFSSFNSISSQAYSIKNSMIEKLESNNSDYHEIEDIKDVIFKGLNEFYLETNGKKLPSNFKMDIRNSIKIYVDSQILKLNTESVSKIRDKLSKSNYMWLLSVKIGGDTYAINIAKGLPFDESLKNQLSNKEIQEIKKDEGKWCLSGIELLKGQEANYYNEISDSMQDISYKGKDVSVYVCGGLEHIVQPAAIVLNNQDDNLLIPLSDLEIEGTNSQIQGLKPRSAHKEDKVYLFDGIRTAVNAMDKYGIKTGGDAYIVLPKNKKIKTEDSSMFYIVGFAILLVSLVSFFGISKFRKGKKEIQK